LTEVESQRHGRAGVITLDRPEALNALTMPMVRAIHAALEDRRPCWHEAFDPVPV
jgi:enoyl-CoA hydratase